VSWTVLVRTHGAEIMESQAISRTRKSLVSRLRKQVDQDSWQAFFEIYSNLIFATAMRAGLSRTDAADVLQETVISVFKGIHHLNYDPEKGSFRSWLLQVTTWRINDFLRKASKRASWETLVDYNTIDQMGGLSSVPAELEQLWNEQWEATLLDGAMERVRQRCDSRQFQLFDLSVVKQWPTKKICSLLRVNATRVYVAKFRISKLVKEELHALKTNAIPNRI
jgi:RNA polymerase sigma factor (sigma-70 family)